MLLISLRRYRSWVPNGFILIIFVCGIVSIANVFIASRITEISDNQEVQITAARLGLCPDISNNPYLIGTLPTDTISNENLKEEEVIKLYPDLKQGGQWTPNDCHAKFRIAVIIPYRDRKSHLSRLLAYLIPVLQSQRLDFRFIVTEQVGNDLFNKGRIMNAAFKYADALGVDCIVFHDVDMVPQSDHVPYTCTSKPLHLGAFVDTLGYELVGDIAGGVTIMSMKHYKTVNGHSNLYWGWGGEDDDMRKRINTKEFKLQRPDSKHIRFSMMNHEQRKRTSPEYLRQVLANATERMATDGLNQALWNVKSINIGPLYHHLFVDVGKAPEEWRLKKNSAFFNSLFFVFLLILVFNI